MGAYEFELPLFLPKTFTNLQFLNNSRFIEVIDGSGNINILSPFTHLPFIRFMARSNITIPIKRYSIDLSFTKNDAGGKLILDD